MKTYKSKIRHCKIGKNVTIVQPVNIYEANIGDGTFIGPFTEIQKGVKIGKNCRVQSHSFICEGVTIEDNVFIGHMCCFINDKKPIANNKNWKMEKTLIKSGASLGSGSIILPVIIGKNARIGAGAVVTKDVPNNAIIVGNPAHILKYKKRTRRNKS